MEGKNTVIKRCRKIISLALTLTLTLTLGTPPVALMGADEVIFTSGDPGLFLPEAATGGAFDITPPGGAVTTAGAFLITAFNPHPYSNPDDPDTHYIVVDLGTPQEEIPLPETLSATVAGGEEDAYPVDVFEWVCEGVTDEFEQLVPGTWYDQEAPGVYRFSPVLLLKENEFLAEGVTPPSADVVVSANMAVRGLASLTAGPLTVEYTAEGAAPAWAGNILTINSKGEYHITSANYNAAAGTNSYFNGRIEMATAATGSTITLDNVWLAMSNYSYALYVPTAVTLNLNLIGYNKLASTNPGGSTRQWHTPLYLPQGGTVNIKSGAPGARLEIRPGNTDQNTMAAGIGGVSTPAAGARMDSGDVNIESGIVEVYGGNNSAAIGGSNRAAGTTNGTGGNVVISDGTTRAVAYYYTGRNASIGSGGGWVATDTDSTVDNGTLKITGGSVYMNSISAKNAVPKGINDENVYCMTLDFKPARANKQIKSLTFATNDGTSLAAYGMNDVYTDTDGKIYLWFREGTYTDIKAAVAATPETDINFYADVPKEEGKETRPHTHTDAGSALNMIPFPDPVKITTVSLGTGKLGVPFTEAVLAATGTVAKWEIISGSLPPGLTSDVTPASGFAEDPWMAPATAKITGTPTAAGTYTVKYKVSNALYEDEKEFTIVIAKADQALPTLTTDPSPVTSPVSITLKTTNPSSDCKSGVTQYRISTSAIWQTSPTFNGLAAVTEYTFYARFAENDDYNAAVSTAYKFSTAAKKNQTAAPNFVLDTSYYTDGITPSSVRLEVTNPEARNTASAAIQYRQGETGNWINLPADNKVTVTGLIPNHSYIFYARFQGDAEYNDSVSSVSAAAPKAALGGTAEIGGKAGDDYLINHQLTASSGVYPVDDELGGLVLSYAETGALTYQWKKDGTDIPGAAGIHYTPAAADVGSYLTFVIKAANCGDSQVTSGAAGPIKKLTRLSPDPTAVVTPDGPVTFPKTVVVVSPAPGALYSFDNGATWEDYQNAKYTSPGPAGETVKIIAYFPGNAEYYDSAPRTWEGSTLNYNQDPPPGFELTYTANGDTDYTVTIPKMPNSPEGLVPEYSFDGVTWEKGDAARQKTGVLTGETATGYVRYSEGNAGGKSYNPSSPVESGAEMPRFKVKKPETDPAELPRKFNGSTEIKLKTQTAGAKIYYTLDGAEPDEGSAPYDGPFTLDDYTTVVTVKARAYKVEMDESDVMEAEFENLDSECLIVSVQAPNDAAIDHDPDHDPDHTHGPDNCGGEVTASVEKGLASQNIEITVSAGASWELFLVHPEDEKFKKEDEVLPDEGKDGEMRVKLSAAGETVVYIKVTSKNGKHFKIYTVTITAEDSGGGDGGNNGNNGSGGYGGDGASGASGSGVSQNRPVIWVNKTIPVYYRLKDGIITLEMPSAKTSEITVNAKQRPDKTASADMTGITEAKAAVFDAAAARAFAKEKITLTLRFPAADITFGTSALSVMGSESHPGNTPVKSAALEIPRDSLTRMQRAQVRGYGEVVNVEMYIGNDKVNIPARVSLPYALKPGESPEAVRVWRLDGEGNITRLAGVYDAETGMITFGADPQRYYAAGYDPVALWENTFRDVDEDAWYYDAIAYVNYYGIFGGYGDGTMRPDAEMTRAMFITALWKADGGTDTADGDALFTDVFPADWYYGAAQWAARSGILNGVGGIGEMLKPQEYVTRQEMAAILLNYAGFKGCAVPFNRAMPEYPDYGAADLWAKPAARKLSEAGVLNGDDTGRFLPHKTATRAEVAQMFKSFVRFVLGR